MRKIKNSVLAGGTHPDGKDAPLFQNSTEADLALVRSSGLFDEMWYLANNPDVAEAKVDPLFHYLRHGGFEGRKPSPRFDSTWYLNTYRDVKESGLSPLVHYLKYGLEKGYSRKFQAENMQDTPFTLKPILITSLGRSGSTLLMQLLGTSREIAFDRVPPFEVRHLTYLLRWSLMLQQQWQPNEIWNAAKSIMRPNEQFGAFPYTESELWAGRSSWPKCFETAWQELSRAAISKAGENNKAEISLKYYAEKSPFWTTEYLNQQSIPYNSVLLVRDPRDIFLSVNAFDKKRGFLGFGRSVNDDDWDFAKKIVENYGHMRKYRTSVSNIVVKYEQLAGNLSSEAERLSQWLNTKLNPILVKQQESNFAAHMTSESPDKSIERWRSELPKDLNDFFVQELGEELRRFGYPT